MSIPKTIARAGHTVDIEQPVSSTDAAGGRVVTYSSVLQGVSCWVQPASSSVVALFAGRNIQVMDTVYFAVNPTVKEGYRLVFGTSYLVVVGVEDQGGLGRLWAVHTRRYT